MKKIITLLFTLVLVSSIVLAEGNAPKTKSQRDNAGRSDAIERSEILLSDTVSSQGLSLALTRVKNENARQKLQQNIEKFQENYKKRLEHMEAVEVEEVGEENGAFKVKAKEPVKLKTVAPSHSFFQEMISVNKRIKEGIL